MVPHPPSIEKEKRRKGAEGRRGAFSAHLLFPFSPLPLFPFSPFRLCVVGLGGNSEFRIPNS
jgi:hypothetical protein